MEKQLLLKCIPNENKILFIFFFHANINLLFYKQTYTSIICLPCRILYRVYLSSLTPHNYSLPHFFFAWQRRSPTLFTPGLFGARFSSTECPLTTSSFSFYRPDDKVVQSLYDLPPGLRVLRALIFRSQHANCKRNVFFNGVVIRGYQLPSKLCCIKNRAPMDQ